ncbi:hypothetical protein FB451DRAFT_1186802 [Mycena latifolia]|nr:hypothetical protein FB451DRAFT_1186802 [Mycena latifolia]
MYIFQARTQTTTSSIKAEPDVQVISHLLAPARPHLVAQRDARRAEPLRRPVRVNERLESASSVMQRAGAGAAPPSPVDADAQSARSEELGDTMSARKSCAETPSRSGLPVGRAAHELVQRALEGGGDAAHARARTTLSVACPSRHDAAEEARRKSKPPRVVLRAGHSNRSQIGAAGATVHTIPSAILAVRLSASTSRPISRPLSLGECGWSGSSEEGVRLLGSKGTPANARAVMRGQLASQVGAQLVKPALHLGTCTRLGSGRMRSRSPQFGGSVTGAVTTCSESRRAAGVVFRATSESWLLALLSPDERCERWLERAAVALLASIIVLTVIRLHFLLGRLHALSTPRRHHHREWGRPAGPGQALHLLPLPPNARRTWCQRLTSSRSSPAAAAYAATQINAQALDFCICETNGVESVTATETCCRRFASDPGCDILADDADAYLACCDSMGQGGTCEL